MSATYRGRAGIMVPSSPGQLARPETSATEILSWSTIDALASEYLNGPEVRFPSAFGWGDLVAQILQETTFVPVSTGDLVLTDYGPDTLAWQARIDADDVVTSYDIMRAMVDDPIGIPVSDVHHDHPYFTREDNLRFRAWHDTAHLVYGERFDAASELRLWAKQARTLTSQGAIDALFCESVYQLSAAVSLGNYPEQQRCVSLGPVGTAVRDCLLSLVRD